MSSLGRYEIQVPLLFNDGSPVPEAFLVQAFEELRGRFGAASWETQVVQGSWEHEGTVFRDNFTRFFVDVPNLPRQRDFFKKFKKSLMQRFKQMDVWITSSPLDVI